MRNRRLVRAEYERGMIAFLAYQYARKYKHNKCPYTHLGGFEGRANVEEDEKDKEG